MAKGKKREDVLPKAVNFEVRPTQEQETVLWRVSIHLCDVYNQALQERQKAYDDFIRPIDEIIRQSRRTDEESGYGYLWSDEGRKSSQKKLLDKGVPLERIENQQSLFRKRKEAFQAHRDKLTFYGQVTNFLTPRRTMESQVYDEEFVTMLRTWQEETLDSVDADFKSFFKLRKNGDVNAKPPQGRREGYWCKIPGRSGFKVEGENIIISLGELGNPLVFKVPAFQLERLSAFPRKAQKKFELYRDERDPEKSGRYWMSIAYDTPKPQTKPILPGNTVYLAIGASRMGIVSYKGEFCINLPRPDYHWKGKGMIPEVEERMEKCVKGSRKWKRRAIARAKMFAKLGHQQKQSQYETISQKLLCHGIHFVVTELVVRQGKPGALADASKEERGGAPFGPNWSAQNTGNIARLVQKLTRKAQELGGIVVKLKPPELSLEERQLPDDQRKVVLARKLREKFLAEK